MSRRPLPSIEENIMSVIRAFDACGKPIARVRINGRGITIEAENSDVCLATIVDAENPDEEIIL